MNPVLIFSLFLAVSCLLLTPVQGEQLSLPEAIALALKDNLAIRAHSWTVVAQEEEFRSARGRYYPTLSVEEQYSRTNNPTYGFMAKLDQERFSREDFLIKALNDPYDISDYHTAVRFEQPLLVPSLILNVGMQGRELKAKRAEHERRKEVLARQVVQSYLAVLTSGEFQKAALAAVKDTQEHKRIASARYDAGAGLYSDVLRAEVAVNNAESQLTSAEGDLAIAERALGLRLGRDGPVGVTKDIPVFPLEDLQIYLNAALDREDIRVLELRHENSLKAVKRERAAFMPEVGLSGSYHLHDHKDPFSPEGESYFVAGVMRWNIFDAASYHNIKKAEARSREVSAELSGLKQEINFRVHEAYTRVKEKSQRRKLAGAVMEEAEEALRLVRVRYENSLAPLTDLLDTQLMLDTARAGRAEAENAYLNALAELYHQSGILLDRLLGIRNEEL